MKTVRRFLGWFFLVIGAFGFVQQPIAGLVLISWGLLLLPFMNQLAARRGLRLDLWKRLGIVFAGILLIGLTAPSSHTPQSVTQQVTPEPTPSASALPRKAKSSSPAKAEPPLAESKASSPAKIEPPLAESKETSIGAFVQKKGLDFSYETAGRIEKGDKSIAVNYIRTWECGAGARERTARQEWQAVFDLSSKKWTDRVRDLNSCLRNADQKWMNYSTTPGKFSIESSGGETVIRADAQDTDGSIVVKDSLVVRYQSDSDSALNISSTTSESSSPSATSQPVKEGVLVAQDPQAQINVRTGAGSSFERRHYGVVGDKVTVITSVRGKDGYTWYQIKFPTSGADGWVRDEFIQVNQ
jgi:hypothetical protein